MILAELTKNLIGKKYELGKIDCFRLIYDYLKSKTEMPEEFNGQTLESYKDLFSEDPENAIALMIAFLETYINEIAHNEIVYGDIVILNYNHQQVFLGIIVGNANVLLVTVSEGVITVPLRYYKIMRAFRCPD